MHGLAADRAVHEQADGQRGEAEVQRDDRHAQRKAQQDTGLDAGRDAFMLARADVLGDVVAHAGAQLGETGDDQVVELDGGGIAGDDGRAVAVDDGLDDDVAHGDKALLRGAGQGDEDDLTQQRKGEAARHAGIPGQRAQAAQDGEDSQHAADALAQERGPGDAGHAHMEARDEEDVDQNVDGGGAGQEEERRAGIAHGGEDAGSHVVVKQERQAEEVDVQVKPAVRHEQLGRVDEGEQLRAQEQAQRHQACAEHAHGDEHSRYGSPQVGILLRAKEAGDDDGAADAAAHGEGDEDQRDLVRVADGRQRVLADPPAGDEAVRDVVELLEDDAAQQRQGKPEQNGLRIADRQILVHMKISSFLQKCGEIIPPCRPGNQAKVGSAGGIWYNQSKAERREEFS